MRKEFGEEQKQSRGSKQSKQLFQPTRRTSQKKKSSIERGKRAALVRTSGRTQTKASAAAAERARLSPRLLAEKSGEV